LLDSLHELVAVARLLGEQHQNGRADVATPRAPAPPKGKAAIKRRKSSSVSAEWAATERAATTAAAAPMRKLHRLAAAAPMRELHWLAAVVTMMKEWEKTA
jgi:uncharacterized protein (DUF58 family)